MTDETAVSSYDRVFAATEGRNIGLIIAAVGGEVQADPDSQGERRHPTKDIRRNGFGYLLIRAHSNDDPSTFDVHGYLVMGTTVDDSGHMKEFMKKYGASCGQDCVLYKRSDSDSASLIGTKDGGSPGLGEILDAGKWHPIRTAEFLSMLDGNRFDGFAIGPLRPQPKYLIPKSFFVRNEREF